MSAKPVLVYGRDACVWCERAKEHLAGLNIPFTYVNLTHEASRRPELDKRLGHPVDTLPQVFIGNQLVGGCTELKALPKVVLQAMVGGA